MYRLAKLFKKVTKVPTDKRRSVVFFRHSYYHFYYLAQALRQRGWDAISVSLDDPVGPFAKYYHGEDLNLYSSNSAVFKKNLQDFFKLAKERFALFHFAGDRCLSFYPENYAVSDPPDIIEWRKLGKKIAYTISGCNSATSQTSVSQWSAAANGQNVCNKCVWQNQPNVCCDKDNLAWGEKIAKYCDLVFAETLPALDYIAKHQNVIRDPLTMCLNPEIWDPNLEIPPKFQIHRENDELLVFHAVGNYETRNVGERNIKGTPAVFAAIDRLKQEGLPIRLVFITDIANKDIRFIQSQADVIVDQLNFGRYGATAREGMMLGKPVICYINPSEMQSKYHLNCLDEIPLISATEETVYTVLKDLLLDKTKRDAAGFAARKYALKWHSAEKCAERYEKVYDALMTDKLKQLIDPAGQLINSGLPDE